MTSEAVVDVLDRTIRALALLDLEDLRILEDRIAVLAQSDLIADDAGRNMVLRKKRVLELVLDESASNLNVLNRLFGRNMRNLWEH